MINVAFIEYSDTFGKNYSLLFWYLQSMNIFPESLRPYCIYLLIMSSYFPESSLAYFNRFFFKLIFYVCASQFYVKLTHSKDISEKREYYSKTDHHKFGLKARLQHIFFLIDVGGIGYGRSYQP